MTINKIAQKQLDSPSTIYFARKGTSDCFWFDLGSLKSYADGERGGRHASLSSADLAAGDWRVIPTKSHP